MTQIGNVGRSIQCSDHINDWRPRSVLISSWRQLSIVHWTIRLLTTWLQICAVCLACSPDDVCDHHSLISSLSASRSAQLWLVIDYGAVCHLIPLRATQERQLSDTYCHGSVVKLFRVITFNEDMLERRYLHFHSQWPWPLDLKFAPLVTLVLRYVSTKLEVSMVFLFWENRRHWRTDRTEEWSTTLNAIPGGRAA